MSWRRDGISALLLGPALCGFMAARLWQWYAMNLTPSTLAGVERRCPVPTESPAAAQGPTRLLLTPREAARSLAVSERTLWGLTHQGAIPCVRLGRAVRYDLVDLQAFIAEKKCNGRPR
jgi:excisionase family DNA binding protein